MGEWESGRVKKGKGKGRKEGRKKERKKGGG